MGTRSLKLCRKRGEHKRGPPWAFVNHFSQKSVLHFYQSYVNIGFATLFQPVPNAFCGAADRFDEGGPYECTREISRINNKFIN